MLDHEVRPELESKADTRDARREAGEPGEAWRDVRPPEPIFGDWAVQRHAQPVVDAAIFGIDADEVGAVRATAAQGIADTHATELPHLERIQQSFGAHDVRSIRAHVGGTSAAAMGATAYAAGGDVVFDDQPDLHTAAHEAAHVVQQAQGVNLYGGVGEAGDAYERAADAVADRVVAGESAADLLGAPGKSTASSTHAVQRKEEPELTRNDHTMSADGHRAHAINAQMRLAAMRVEDASQQINSAVDAKLGERSADVVLDAVKPHYDDANGAGHALLEIWADMMRMQFRDRDIRDGLGILNNAHRHIRLAHAKLQRFAGAHKLTLGKGLDTSGVDSAVSRFGQILSVPTEGAGASFTKEDPNVTDTGLIKEAVSESLDAVESSAQALGMAMRENNPKEAAGPLVQPLLTDLHLLQMSIPKNARTSQQTLLRYAKLALRIQQAWIDGQPFGFQQNAAMSQVMAVTKDVQHTLEATAKAKK